MGEEANTGEFGQLLPIEGRLRASNAAVEVGQSVGLEGRLSSSQNIATHVPANEPADPGNRAQQPKRGQGAMNVEGVGGVVQVRSEIGQVSPLNGRLRSDIDTRPVEAGQGIGLEGRLRGTAKEAGQVVGLEGRTSSGVNRTPPLTSQPVIEPGMPKR